jgi:hypothetical protein
VSSAGPGTTCCTAEKGLNGLHAAAAAGAAPGAEPAAASGGCAAPEKGLKGPMDGLSCARGETQGDSRSFCMLVLADSSLPLFCRGPSSVSQLRRHSLLLAAIGSCCCCCGPAAAGPGERAPGERPLLRLLKLLGTCPCPPCPCTIKGLMPEPLKGVRCCPCPRAADSTAAARGAQTAGRPAHSTWGDRPSCTTNRPRARQHRRSTQRKARLRAPKRPRRASATLLLLLAAAAVAAAAAACSAGRHGVDGLEAPACCAPGAAATAACCACRSAGVRPSCPSPRLHAARAVHIPCQPRPLQLLLLLGVPRAAVDGCTCCGCGSARGCCRGEGHACC